MTKVTPDGHRYLAMASGQRIARPFHLRWLIPAVCGTSPTKWRAVRYAAVCGLIPAAWWYGGFGWRGLFVALFVVGLSGVWKFNLTYPVLVDAPAMVLALLSACLFRAGGVWIAAAIAVVLVAGMTKETSPAFAALWAWSPLLLVGLLAPAVRMLWRSGDDVLDDENRWILEHPFKASRKYHKDVPTWAWVLPWGAGVVSLANGSPQLAVTLAVAYAQCAIATDTVRLYQWAFPVVAVAAAGAVPLEWLPVLAAVHLVNPFATEGV